VAAGDEIGKGAMRGYSAIEVDMAIVHGLLFLLCVVVQLWRFLSSGGGDVNALWCDEGVWRLGFLVNTES
jgi:hypothetical protein